jgi:exo-beta-1,3-glucanase (GH17 family)
MLGVERGDKIVLSFWARSDTGAFIECKAGGVNRGRFPDSVPFAKSTRYFKAGPQWTKKTIDLTNEDLTNLVGGFCVVTDKAHNRGKDSVWFFLDDIRIEAVVDRPPFTELMQRLRWVAYSPTEYNPHAAPVQRPSDESIRADLMVLRPYFDGLVTYGCTNGLERVPAIARELGFEGFIQGVWDPKRETELANVRQLAAKGLLDAVCCGNEGLDTRYDWAVLDSVMTRLRQETKLPVTTTEQIEDYGDDRLIRMVDWVFPNAHPVWHRQLDIDEAVAWLRTQLRSLAASASGKPILVKETGWPSAGGTAFTPDAQREFWLEASRAARELKVPLVMFEAFEVPWKTEDFDGGDVGAHWGLFDSERRPKPVVEILKRDSK